MFRGEKCWDEIFEKLMQIQIYLYHLGIYEPLGPFHTKYFYFRDVKVPF